MATLKEIAELVGTPKPAIEPEILRVSSIEAATPVTLVFAMDGASLAAALNSLAGAESGGRKIDRGDPRLLLVADPRYAFATAASFLRGREEAETGVTPGVHPTAVIGANVRLGNG